MTLNDIQRAVCEGKIVCWATPAYRVILDSIGQWLIHCTINDSYIGLTHMDGVTMNGKEEEFFVLEEPPQWEDPSEVIKEEAREAGYEEGYLAALSDLSSRIGYLKEDEDWHAELMKLAKMVTSR
jgi:hypothetical protein